MDELEIRLNCTRCGKFTNWRSAPTSIYCKECGKKHSRDSLYAIDPAKTYLRDESGKLMDTTP